MNNDNKFLILICIVGLIFGLLIVRSLISFAEDTDFRNNNFCKLRYGTKERGNEEFFGKFCAEIDYENHKVIKHYYTHKEMMDYCGRIGFWELNKWVDKCEF